MELEKSLLRGLIAGALWTAVRVSGDILRTNSACPNREAAREDKVHVLCNCLEWEQARETVSRGCGTRRPPSPSRGRLTSDLPAYGGRASALSASRRGWNGRS